MLVKAANRAFLRVFQGFLRVGDYTILPLGESLSAIIAGTIALGGAYEPIQILAGLLVLA